MRRVEVLCLIAFGVLVIALTVRVAPHAVHSPWLSLIAAGTAYLAADFLSGIVHWAADTWGKTSTPGIGQAILRSFREHHVNQGAIARHDFIETNGNSCFLCIPAAAGALLLPQSPGAELSLFCAVFTDFLVLFTFLTNQFHKWAHSERPPAPVAWLQRWHLILPPAHHARHHTPPFNRYYCITVGWLNRPLTWIRFFPALEALVHWLTGAIPRSDDIGLPAALAITQPEPASSTVLAPTKAP